MSNLSNADRAAWAQEALDSFRYATHMNGEEDDVVLSDLLCDLLHWCDLHNQDFDAILTQARGAHAEELKLAVIDAFETGEIQ